MSATTLTIPAGYIAAVTDSVLALYGSTAETIHKTIVQYDDLADAQLELRARRWRLGQLGSLLDQLEGGGAPGSDACSVRGERHLIEQALHGVLCDHAEALGGACQRFLDGGGTAPLREHQRAVADVLRLLAAIGPDSGTPLPLPADAAEAVGRVADRTGYTPGEIVTAALEWHLRHDDDPDPPGRAGTEA